MDRCTYLKSRFGRSQSIINWREQLLVAGMLAQIKPAPARILDLPCGYGRFTRQLRNAATEKLVCSDHNPYRIKALIAAEPDFGTPIETKVCDLFEHLEFPQNEFDLVFNFRFFHHIESTKLRLHVINELIRVSNQYLIISYYHTAPLHILQKKIWRHKGHKRKLPMVSRRSLLEIFRNLGCEVLHDVGVLPGIHAHRIALFKKTFQ